MPAPTNCWRWPKRQPAGFDPHAPGPVRQQRVNPLRVAIGADHQGFEAKEAVKLHLGQAAPDGGRVIVSDAGIHAPASADYPLVAAQVARMVSRGECDRGILICGSGIGTAVVANKVRGVIAATVTDLFGVQLCRRHLDANVLCLAARQTAIDLMRPIVDVFLATPFEGGRHGRRVGQIREIEQEELGGRAT